MDITWKTIGLRWIISGFRKKAADTLESEQ